jgi:hypothetical protein
MIIIVNKQHSSPKMEFKFENFRTALEAGEYQRTTKSTLNNVELEIDARAIPIFIVVILEIENTLERERARER